MPYLYHAATEADWQKALNTGTYVPAAFAQEGFIHLSTRSTLPQSVDLHCAALERVVVLVLSERLLNPKLQWVPVPSRGDRFPHYPARLPIDLVVDVAVVERGQNGEWDWSDFGY
ncbi:MAG: DUF952 domain-containing protein [Sphingobacteriia bacterium]|jgi:uncharacterized protein (DUF952 family)